MNIVLTNIAFISTPTRHHHAHVAHEHHTDKLDTHWLTHDFRPIGMRPFRAGSSQTPSLCLQHEAEWIKYDDSCYMLQIKQ